MYLYFRQFLMFKTFAALGTWAWVERQHRNDLNP